MIQTIKFIILALATHPFLFTWITYPFLVLTQGPIDRFAQFQKQNKTVSFRKSMPQNFLCKMTWQQALLGIEELSNFESREKDRIDYGKSLYEKIEQANLDIQLPQIVNRGQSGFWLFPILSQNSKVLKSKLLRLGVDCSEMLLSHLASESEFHSFHLSAPNAKKTKESILFIPMYSKLTQEQLEHIVDSLKSVCSKS